MDAEIPALITALAAVDYLAGFHAGRESRSSDYELFMERYFPAAYRPFLDRIYSDLRCGLVHNIYRAWVMYAHPLIMGPKNEEAVARFHSRFNRLAGVGALMERVPD